MFFDHKLVQVLNSGECIVLVGSGPSVDAGYPTWRDLANRVIERLRKMGKLSDEPSYTKYLTDNKLPELFSLAQSDFGGRKELVDALREELTKKRAGAVIYELLADWPFQFYLTTNWDDELFSVLRSKKLYFAVLHNSKTDFSLIRRSSRDYIIKIHSDLSHPDQAVITAETTHGWRYRQMVNIFVTDSKLFSRCLMYW